jgi:hypothetical protein
VPPSQVQRAGKGEIEMLKLTTRKSNQLFSYLLKANTLLNEAVESSDDGEIGIAGNAIEDICNLAEALKLKVDNIQWV